MSSTNVIAQEPKRPSDKPAFNTSGEALYWCGALPATGSVELRKAKREAEVGGKFFEVVNRDPWDLWNITAGVDDARVWVGKCRFLQGLDSRGLSFPAYSEIPERQAANEAEITMTAFPGHLAAISRTRVAAGLASCWRHVVRYPMGVEHQMKLQSGVELLDLDLGTKPFNMTEAAWDAYKLNRATSEAVVFNPDTDVRIAEFVYCIELTQADPAIVRGMKADPLQFLPQAIQLLPHGRMTEAFFRNPPKSVAEMYGAIFGSGPA